MRHTEESIKRVKKSLAEMWLLVQGQVEKVSAALLERNRELALEVRSREKMVDAYELTVDRECENFFGAADAGSRRPAHDAVDRQDQQQPGAHRRLRRRHRRLRRRKPQRQDHAGADRTARTQTDVPRDAVHAEPVQGGPGQRGQRDGGQGLRQRQSGRPDQRRRDRRAGRAT